ncbi:MAG: hypothetical protein ACLSVD_00560 [Eggerthellaceae bacterium]
MDVTDKVSVGGAKLQKKSGDSWLDIPAGTADQRRVRAHLYRLSIPDMTDACGRHVHVHRQRDDHFLASDWPGEPRRSRPRR